MSTVAVIVLAAGVVIIGALLMALIFRGSKREPEIEHEQDVVLEEQLTGSATDWEADLKPPRDPY